MANLEVSYSSAALNPTRQQLDELDTLLQQMLGLPVQPAAEEAGPRVAETANQEPDYRATAPEPETALEPAPPPSAAPAPIIEEPVERIAAQGRTEFQPAPPPGRMGNPFYEPAPEGIAALEQLEAELHFKLQASDKAAASPPRKPDSGEAERTSAWLGPLVWCNLIFDGVTLPLGPLGRGLRSPSGRKLLGWAGLLLLALATGLTLLDWIRWIW